MGKIYLISNFWGVCHWSYGRKTTSFSKTATQSDSRRAGRLPRMGKKIRHGRKGRMRILQNKPLECKSHAVGNTSILRRRERFGRRADCASYNDDLLNVRPCGVYQRPSVKDYGIRSTKGKRWNPLLKEFTTPQHAPWVINNLIHLPRHIRLTATKLPGRYSCQYTSSAK